MPAAIRGNSAQNHCTVPNVAKIPYFEDMFPFMANSDYNGESATQAIYNDRWSNNRYGGGETNALYSLDLYDNPAGPQFQFSRASSPRSMRGLPSAPVPTTRSRLRCAIRPATA